jgi:hypothetical protein
MKTPSKLRLSIDASAANDRAASALVAARTKLEAAKADRKQALAAMAAADSAVYCANVAMDKATADKNAASSAAFEAYQSAMTE